MTMGSGSRPFPPRVTVAPMLGPNRSPSAQEHHRQLEEKKNACEEEEWREIEMAKLVREKQREHKEMTLLDTDGEEDEEEEVAAPLSPKLALEKENKGLEYSTLDLVK
ncbi:hypothetical protein BU17DRAFT_82801 [Hysterangium stoloniferum]|nr:hypothetical protein BU17DRAFT_82801 [Hysterangium stoloniferum]